MDGRRETPQPEVLLGHAAFVRRVARGLLRDEAQVDDVLQQTWLAALTRPPGAGNLRGWLAAVARNLALRFRRAEGRRRRHERASAPSRVVVAPPEDTLHRLDVQRRVVEAVMRLDEPYRATVVLHYFDGLDTREVARRMDVRPQTVRTRLRRARDRLRVDLDRRCGGRGAWTCVLLPLLARRRVFARSYVATALAGSVAVVSLLCAEARPERPRAAERVHDAANAATGGDDMRATKLYAGAALLALTAGAEAKSPYEGEWRFRMERPGWQPRVVTGILHLEKGREGWTGWISYLDLDSWTGVPLDAIEVDREGIRAEVRHPIWTQRLEGSLSRKRLRGTLHWGPRRFPWEAEAGRTRRFEKGLSARGFLPRAEAEKVGLDGAALDGLIAAAATSDSDALIVLKDDRVLCERYFGREPEPIALMSVTKVFAGLAVMLLVDEGRIPSLDTPLSRWFSEWAEGRKAKVTVRHVLTHTSGLEHDRRADAIYRATDQLAFARASAVVAEPGADWSYNNRAFVLLAGVIAASAGRQADQYLQEKLFEPLDIRDWRWRKDPAGNVHTFADLALRPRDLAKVGRLLLADGMWKGKRVLSPGLLARMMEPGPGLRRRMGIAWWLRYDDLRAPVKQTKASLAAFEATGFELAGKLSALTGKAFASGAEYERAALKRMAPTDEEAGALLWRLRTGLVPYESEARPWGAYHSGDYGQHFVLYPREGVVALRLRSPRGRELDAATARRAGLRAMNALVELCLR